MLEQEKLIICAKQLKHKLETQLTDFKQKYYYKFPNLYIEIGELFITIHIVHTEVENPKYLLMNEKSYVNYDRDFIVGVSISKEGKSIITGFCLEGDLEFYSMPSPYPNPNSPCYGIPICKLKNITNIANIIKLKVQNTFNNAIE